MCVYVWERNNGTRHNGKVATTTTTTTTTNSNVRVLHYMDDDDDDEKHAPKINVLKREELTGPKRYRQKGVGAGGPGRRTFCAFIYLFTVFHTLSTLT